MKAKLSVILQRILGPHQRTIRHRQPVHQPRQQETHSRTARQDREGVTLTYRKRSDLAVAVEQRAPLGDVVGMIDLEAPGIEANRDVVRERIRAGEIEINEAGNRAPEEENVVGKKIGMNHALRQFAWPGSLERIELFCYFRAKPLPYAVAASLGVLEEMPPASNGQRVRALGLEVATRQMQPCQRVTHRPAMSGA